MANPEHVAVLKRGVRAIAEWRKANPRAGLDLVRAVVAAKSLARADLRFANLKSSLVCADLEEANLYKADLSNSALSGIILRGANLIAASLLNADIIGTDLRQADLSEATLNAANLNRADLSGACLAGANLGEANLCRANLTEANLDGADLTGAHLSTANLTRASLVGADLTGANLDWAELTDANLDNTILFRADFNGARLLRTSLREARVGNTSFPNIDLSVCSSLADTQHIRPSSIGIDTIYASNGRIPEAFLRGCGVPDTFIEYIPSLIGAQKAIEFYSCFISYSSKDEEFCKRLHSRMRDEHLRVWFAPEDMQGGQKLHEQIDAAIKVYDKLLLVLSKSSMESTWVANEIRAAFDKQRREGKRTLFPISLVPFKKLEDWKLIDSRSGVDLAEEIRQFHIPNFADWKDHDAFEAEFQKLFHDLQDEERQAA